MTNATRAYRKALKVAEERRFNWFSYRIFAGDWRACAGENRMELR